MGGNNGHEYGVSKGKFNSQFIQGMSTGKSFRLVGSGDDHGEISWSISRLFLWPGCFFLGEKPHWGFVNPAKLRSVSRWSTLRQMSTHKHSLGLKKSGSGPRFSTKTLYIVLFPPSCSSCMKTASLLFGAFRYRCLFCKTSLVFDMYASSVINAKWHSITGMWMHNWWGHKFHVYFHSFHTPQNNSSNMLRWVLLQEVLQVKEVNVTTPHREHKLQFTEPL